MKDWQRKQWLYFVVKLQHEKDPWWRREYVNAIKTIETKAGKCETCFGTGLVDSGGQDQNGNWVDILCPDCK